MRRRELVARHPACTKIELRSDYEWTRERSKCYLDYSVQFSVASGPLGSCRQSLYVISALTRRSTFRRLSTLMFVNRPTTLASTGGNSFRNEIMSVMRRVPRARCHQLSRQHPAKKSLQWRRPCAELSGRGPHEFDLPGVTACNRWLSFRSLRRV